MPWLHTDWSQTQQMGSRWFWCAATVENHCSRNLLEIFWEHSHQERPSRMSICTANLACRTLSMTWRECSSPESVRSWRSTIDRFWRETLFLHCKWRRRIFNLCDSSSPFQIYSVNLILIFHLNSYCHLCLRPPFTGSTWLLTFLHFSSTPEPDPIIFFLSQSPVPVFPPFWFCSPSSSTILLWYSWSRETHRTKEIPSFPSVFSKGIMGGSHGWELLRSRCGQLQHPLFSSTPHPAGSRLPPAWAPASQPLTEAPQP